MVENFFYLQPHYTEIPRSAPVMVHLSGGFRVVPGVRSMEPPFGLHLTLRNADDRLRSIDR